MNKVVGQILHRLIEEPIFEGFKIRKSDECLIKKSKEGWQQISLNDHFQSIDLSNHRLALQIRPLIVVRYDILSKWFEKHSFKRIKTQRLNGQISSAVGNFGEVEYLFYNEGDCFEEQYQKIRDDIISESNVFFEKYSSMEKMYINDVLPKINGEEQFQKYGGVDWIFEYLKLTWIVDRENYLKLKGLILKHIDFRMFGRTFPEPNMAKYYDRLEEIFTDLEQN